MADVCFINRTGLAKYGARLDRHLHPRPLFVDRLGDVEVYDLPIILPNYARERIQQGLDVVDVVLAPVCPIERHRDG